MLNVLVVAHDLTPSRALRKLIPHIASRTARPRVDSVLLDGGSIPPPSDTSLEEKVRDADIVVVGMSTPNSEIEVRASQLCATLKKTFGYFADTHGAEQRAAFTPFRNLAHFVFVVGESEIKRTQSLFPNASVLATGNPLWADFFAPADRSAIRSALGIDATTFTILAPGTKNMTHNMCVWIPLVYAANRMRYDGRLDPVRILLSPHERDATPYESYLTLCDLARGLGLTVEVVKDGNAVLPGVDAVINGTSLRSHAVARRIPVVDYYETLSQVWLERDTGSRETYYSKIGASIGVFGKSWVELTEALRSVRENPRMLLERQTDAIPARTESEMLDSMCGSLQSFT